jgi:hypothetical protein
MMIVGRWLYIPHDRVIMTYESERHAKVRLGICTSPDGRDVEEERGDREEQAIGTDLVRICQHMKRDDCCCCCCCCCCCWSSCCWDDR